MTETELCLLLENNYIDCEKFGKDTAKQLTNLLQEVSTGECDLVESNGQLLRRLSVIEIDVFAVIGSKRLRLVELYQEFSDGRVRKRQLKRSVNEKTLPGEDHITAINRALVEELGITRYRITTPTPQVSVETKVSPSYPGLKTEYTLTYVRVLIPASAYKAEGYIEVQSDKSTCFVWIPARRC